MLNPWFLLAMVLAIGGAGYTGFRLGSDHEIARQAKLEAVIQTVADKAQQAAAHEISKIKIVNQTNRQILERETRVVPDYSACRHSADGLRATNQALTNQADAAGNRVVPDADPVSR